jgi:hypothetical protein
MSDMLSLMYRYSVDTLGAVIAPITIVVLYMFRQEFEVGALYAMRASDLRFFMLFSFFIVPAMWIVDIFLFNLEELLWSWKLFEYIQFCQERYKNRSRRWVGLDTTINEELPPDLRAMDQMCLSVQFFMLGSLHASGIVMAVLGYMLVLHKSHNIFGDPMVMPIFFLMLLAFNVGRRLVLRIADRFKVWMVEGEADYEEVYDEGPGSRNQGALPPGMAAVDMALAECIDDAFAVGYTDETLAKLLMEVVSYIPPGSSIQVAGTAGTNTNMKVGSGAGAAVDNPVGVPLHQISTVAGGGWDPCASPMMLTSSLAMPFAAPMLADAPRGTFDSRNQVAASIHRAESGQLQRPHALPQCVPLLPGQNSAFEGEVDSKAFSEFMSAFRTEMLQAKERGERKHKFVPSTKSQLSTALETRAEAVYGLGVEARVQSSLLNEEGQDTSFEEWPDEFLLLGVAEQDADAGSTPSPESETSTTTDTATTEEDTDETEYEEDAWPIEMLVG